MTSRLACLGLSYVGPLTTCPVYQICRYLNVDDLFSLSTASDETSLVCVAPENPIWLDKFLQAGMRAWCKNGMVGLAGPSRLKRQPDAYAHVIFKIKCNVRIAISRLPPEPGSSFLPYLRWKFALVRRLPPAISTSNGVFARMGVSTICKQAFSALHSPLTPNRQQCCPRRPRFC